jgi:hypothetical protein
VNSFEADTCRSCGEALSTGDLIREFKVEEAKSKLKTNMIEREIGLEDEELEKEAERIIEEQI